MATGRRSIDSQICRLPAAVHTAIEIFYESFIHRHSRRESGDLPGLCGVGSLGDCGDFCLLLFYAIGD